MFDNSTPMLKAHTPRHTPGPWVVAPPDGHTIGPSCVLVCSATTHLQAVAVVTLRTGETEANARVIALAPDLLKLAHAAFHALQSYAHGNAAPDLASEVASALEKTIAKAEGTDTDAAAV